MFVNDPVADMLTRIRNGISVKLKMVEFPHSKLRVGVIEVLKREGYIKDYEVIELEGDKKNIKVFLKYNSGKSVISVINKVSKLGKRDYRSVKSIGRFFNGLGIYVLTTSKGIVSDDEARKLNVGGEILCKVF